MALCAEAVADTEAYVKKIVNDQDLSEALKYVSIYELVNYGTEEVFLEFPDLRPPSSVLETQLRRELIWYLGLTSDKEIDDAMAGKPSRFKMFPKVAKQMKEMARKDLPNLEKRGKTGFRDENDWIYFVAYYRPMSNLLTQKIDCYKERGYTEKQINEEIRMKSSMAIHLFFHDAKQTAAAYRELKGPKKEEKEEEDGDRKKFDSPTKFAFDMYCMETQEFDLDRVFKYISIYELGNYIVEDVIQKYPEMKPETDEETKEVKRQLIEFAIASDEERVMAVMGFISRFNLIHKSVEKLWKIATRELPNREGPLVNTIRDEEDFVRFHGYTKPIMDLLRVKIESYEQRGMTKAEIKEEMNFSEYVFVYNLYGDKAKAPVYVRRAEE